MKRLGLIATFCVLCTSWMRCLAQAPNPSGAPQVGTFSQVLFPLLTALPPVKQANIAIVGNPGNGTYFYWIVTNYEFGQTSPQGPFTVVHAPTVLTGSNYVTITPQYLAGATVDVLKTTSLIPPSGTGNYAVSTGNTSGTISDTGAGLSSYTVAPASPGNFILCLSNQVVGEAESHLILGQGPGCPFVADLSLAGGGSIGGSGTPGNFAGFATSTTLQNAPATYAVNSLTLTEGPVSLELSSTSSNPLQYSDTANGDFMDTSTGASSEVAKGFNWYVNSNAAFTWWENENLLDNQWLSLSAAGAVFGLDITLDGCASGTYVKADGTGCGTPGGSGTVNTGTATQLGYYQSSGTTISPDTNLTDNGSTLGYAGTVQANTFTGQGALLLTSSVPPSNFSPSSSGLSGIAIQDDGNLYLSQGNTSSTTSGAFEQVPVVAAATGAANGPAYLTGSTATLVGETQPIDAGPNSTVAGTDCFAKANTIIAAAPSAGFGIIDLRGWSAGCTAQHDMFDANGTLNTNKPGKVLLPAGTIYICQPMITPSGHIEFVATYNTQSIGNSGSLIIAGTSANGCPGNFPNGGATMTWTHPHPPFTQSGGAASGAYVALWYDGAQANGAARQTLNWTQQSFGTVITRGITLDCAGLCDFDYYSASKEEHTIIDNAIVRNYLHAGIFGDRLESNAANGTAGGSATQSGPGNWQLFGIQGQAYSTVTAGTPFKVVFMGSNTLIDLEGGGCAALGDGMAAHAYTKVTTGGGLSAPVLTNAGSGCTSAPSCSVYAPASNPTTAAACVATEAGGSVTGVTFSNTPAGYWLGGSEVTGIYDEGGWGVSASSPYFDFDTVVSGTTQTHLDHLQCQGVVSGCVDIGWETAPNDGGLVNGPNVGNETGNASAVQIDKGSDGNVIIHDACQQDPISATRNIIVDNVFGRTITTGASGTAPFCIPIYTQGQAYAGTLNVANGSETSPSLTGPNGGGLWFPSSSAVPCLGPGVTNDSACFPTDGTRLGNGQSFEFSNSAAPSTSKALGLSATSTGFSFDTGTAGNAAANILAAQVTGLSGVTATPGISESWAVDTSASHPVTAFAVISNGANPVAVRNALTTSTAGVLGVCVSGCNATGPAIVARTGQTPAAFDGATTSGDYVQLSTTAAGEFHDAGSTCPASASGQVLGKVLSTNGGGGTYTLEFNTGLCIDTTNGTVTSVTFTGDGTVLSSTPSSAVTSSGTVTATLASSAGGTVLNNATAASATASFTNALTLGVPSSGGSPTTGAVKLYNSANTGSVTISPASGTLAATLTAPDVAATIWVSSGTNAAASGSILNLGSATGTAAFVLPSNTSNTASAAGAMDFDTTNKNFHGYVNGADSIFLNVAAAPTTNVMPKYVVSSGNTLMGGSSITDNGTTVSTAETITVGAAAGSAAVTDKSAGFLASAMSPQTTATCTTITGMNWNLAANKNYNLECKIPVTLAATATIQFCLNGPGTATSYSLMDEGALGAAGAWAQSPALIQTAWQTKTSASSATANDTVIHVWAGIQNGSTASGTQLALQTAANGTNAITVGANATCVLTQTN